MAINRFKCGRYNIDFYMFSFFYVVKEDYRGKEEVDGGGG